MKLSDEGRVRILIADDHAVLRAGLRALFASQPDLEVVGETASGADVVRRAAETAADLVVLDLSMADGPGLEALERLRAERPETRVVILTMHEDTAYLRAALAAGCWGYVMKRSAGSDLLSAVRAVRAGRRWVDPALGHEVAVRLLDRRRAPTAGREGRSSPLSEREQQVIVLLARGLTAREIASHLRLSAKTIETYRARVAEKLGLSARADFVRYAFEAGLVTREEIIQPLPES